MQNQNFVIVTGRPGSGKSAIIKHIALKYFDRGWIVKPVKMADEMFEICQTGKWSKYTVLFVLDDQIGKDSLNDIMYKIWDINTEKLMNCLKTVKLLLSCRKSILFDNGIFNNQTKIVDIDNDKFTLTKGEKQNILSNYFPNLNLSEEDIEDFYSIGQFFSIENSCESVPSNKEGGRFYDIEGDGLLYKTCQIGHDKIVQLLLKNGANANAFNRNGYSPLYAAVQQGHAIIVQLLIHNRADINMCSEYGDTPLCVASYIRHENIVQMLLSYGANVNLCRKDGTSPLYIACQNGYYSLIQILLSSGADINAIMKNRLSPLCTACEKGHESTVQLLLCVGAVVNFRMENGVSPLHIACQNNNKSIVQLLLNNGADINLCTKAGLSPLYIARQTKNDLIVNLLLSKTASVHLGSNTGDSDSNKDQSFF